MLPWGHLALGYLWYAVWGRLDAEVPRTETGAIAVALGSQAPDLDKVLAWWFGVVPNGRSLAHSVLIAAVVLVIVRRYAVVRGRSHRGSAFALGYLSHLLGDALYPLLYGNLSALRFLAWPVVPAIEYDQTGGFLAFFTSLDFGVTFWAELGLFVVAFAVWSADGRPGLGLCREQVSRWLDAARTTPR
jgi:membrane-bound metal-dependent hydrolase YbcI (DUF457 family)